MDYETFIFIDHWYEVKENMDNSYYRNKIELDSISQLIKKKLK